MKLRYRDTNVQNNVQAKRRKTEEPLVKRKKIQRSSYDAKLLNHPHAVANFATDIFHYLQNQESKYQLPASLKTSVKELHRALIVDWLIDCTEDMSFTHETLYTAIRLFDLYVVKNPSAPSSKLQLVASSSLLIASKVEEYKPISIKTLEKLCEPQYKRDEFKVMEREVLRATQCDVGFPLAYSFQRRYARVIGASMELLTLARFYLEVATHYTDWSLELPSKLAVVSLILALRKSEPKLDWVSTLQRYSGYLLVNLDESVEKLDQSVANFKSKFPKCTVVIKKYSTDTFFEVSKKFMA